MTINLYHTLYVKGHPIEVRVEAMNNPDEEGSEEVLSSYRDPYAANLKKLHTCLTQEKPIVITPEDTVNQSRLFKMMFGKPKQQETGDQSSLRRYSSTNGLIFQITRSGKSREPQA